MFKTKLKTNMTAQSTSYASAILLKTRLRVLGVVGLGNEGLGCTRTQACATDTESKRGAHSKACVALDEMTWFIGGYNKSSTLCC